MDNVIREQEAAKILGVSVGTLRRDRYSAEPKVPFRKLGDAKSKAPVLYDRQTVERIAAERRAKALAALGVDTAAIAEQSAT